MEICSSNSIRNMDKDYIEKFNMPSIVLMENAIIKFLENIDTDNIYYTTISTKSYVERAYSQLDLQEWDKMDAQIQEGINNYAELLKNADIEGSKSYTINKTYVMLNELKNAINIKDREVFLIKYKNQRYDWESV